MEAGETPRGAALRELREETGLVGRVDQHLWTLEHEDRLAHYFRVTVGHGPLILAGPELVAQSSDNRYAPQWISLRDPALEHLRPAEVRPLLDDLSERADA